MDSGLKTQCVPGYRLLTEEQIKEIHRASLEVLETIGVRVFHEEGVQLLRDAGCRVKEGDTVQIPNWLVEEAIRSAPSRITMYNRIGEEAMRLWRGVTSTLARSLHPIESLAAWPVVSGQLIAI